MANPLMWEKAFQEVRDSVGETMTLEGTVNKSILLVGVVILSAVWVWNYIELFLPYLFPIIITAFVIALIVIFKKTTAPYLALVYAILEWMALWVISAMFEASFPGIIIQAVSATMWVFLIMLFMYKSKILQATPAFKKWVMAATGWIMILYMVSLLWTLTGWYTVPYLHEGWAIGIGLSVFIVWIAAFNLILDFDNIEMGVKLRAPKYMEWYTSFWLLITLVWLYLEILRLIAKIRGD